MLEQSVGSEGRPEATVDEEPDAREVARLERLLAARSQERRELHDELARTTALLRDALGRFAHVAPPPALPRDAPGTHAANQDTSPDGSHDALERLRAERDAAVAQALEAEASRAETAFRLDETLGHLLAERASHAEQAALFGTVRGLRARTAEAEEALAVADARVLLGEQDLVQAREQTRALEAQHQEAAERFEFELLHLRGALASEGAQVEHAQIELALARDTSALEVSSLRGERDGLSARVDEGESAFTVIYERLARAERNLAETSDKLARARTEQAEQQLLNQAQKALAGAGQSKQLERARELHRTLRLTLEELRAPLHDLATTVHSVAAGSAAASSVPAGSEVTEESTVPAMVIPPDALDAIERKLGVSERRIQELEAQLAARPRDSSSPASAPDFLARDSKLSADFGTARDPKLSALKGELIDVRANATRLADDLTKERARRRKLAVTVRALQAATESGESPAPWIEDLLSILAEGATVPPLR